MEITYPYIKLAGTGSFLPGEKIPFDQVDYYLGELPGAPEKIRKWQERMKKVMKEILDVEYYHYAIDPVSREFTEDNITMSVKASIKALETAGIHPGDVEFIVYGSAHQDQMPTASVRIQEALGIRRCSEISVHANCTSAYKALLIAHDMIRNGRYKNALVISSSMASSELIAEYYNQPLLRKEELFLRYFLCDGAGAFFLSAETEKSDGLFLENVYIESLGGSKPSAMQNRRPAYWMNPAKEYALGYHHLAQMFQDELRRNFHEEDGSVFYKGLKRMLEKYPVNLPDVRFFQVNFPAKHIAEIIIEECEQLGIPKEKLYTKISSMGYAGPPMAFICIDRIMREEQLHKNEIILSFVTEVSKFMQAGFTMVKY